VIPTYDGTLSAALLALVGTPTDVCSVWVIVTVQVVEVD
jgi:hypothetical protein